jgi:ATP-dependent Clp protease ATP-binding subunit ClpA
MPQWFNKKSQSVLRKAQHFAVSSDGVVTPMHVLAALLEVAPDIWLDLPDVDIQAIRTAARVPDAAETTSSQEANTVLANSVKRVLAYAMEERFRARGEVVDFFRVSEFLEPEFIVLGLLREVESDAAQLLTTHGLTLEKGRSCLPAGPNA